MKVDPRNVFEVVVGGMSLLVETIHDSPLAGLVLAPQQHRVYEWFIVTGLTGTFNNKIIAADLGMSTFTVKKCVTKLTELSLLTVEPYNATTKRHSYILHVESKKKFFGSKSKADAIRLTNLLNLDGTPIDEVTRAQIIITHYDEIIENIYKLKNNPVSLAMRIVNLIYAFFRFRK